MIKTPEDIAREIRLKTPEEMVDMLGDMSRPQAIRAFTAWHDEAVEDRDIEIRALERMIEQRDQARIDAIHKKAERIRQAKSECKEWDALSKEEMWETIQNIRRLVGNDGTESLEETVEKMNSQIVDAIIFKERMR